MKVYGSLSGSFSDLCIYYYVYLSLLCPPGVSAGGAGCAARASVSRAHGSAVPRDAAQRPRRHPCVHIRGDALGDARS